MPGARLPDAFGSELPIDAKIGKMPPVFRREYIPQLGEHRAIHIQMKHG
jgi:hypothetical protein